MPAVFTISGTKQEIMDALGANSSPMSSQEKQDIVNEVLKQVPTNDHIQQIMLSKEQEQIIINTITRKLNLHPTSSLNRQQVAQMITDCTREFITSQNLSARLIPFVRRSDLETMLNDYESKADASTKWTKQDFLNYANSDIFKKYIKSIIPLPNEEYKLTRLGKENDIMDIYVYQMKHCFEHNKIPYYVEIRNGKELFHPILWIDEDNDIAMYQDWDNAWKPIGLTSGETTMLSKGEYIIT